MTDVTDEMIILLGEKPFLRTERHEMRPVDDDREKGQMSKDRVDFNSGLRSKDSNAAAEIIRLTDEINRIKHLQSEQAILQSQLDFCRNEAQDLQSQVDVCRDKEKRMNLLVEQQRARINLVEQDKL